MVKMRSTLSATLCVVSLAVIPGVHASRITPRTITSLVVSEDGRSLDHNEREINSCKRFKPAKGDIEQFLLRSYPVPAKIGAHDRYSPCYANGIVEFSDNTRGQWKISSSGTGTLHWDTGDIVTLFDPYYQWHDPFACMYGPEEDDECEDSQEPPT